MHNITKEDRPMSILIISDRESDLSSLLARAAPCKLVNFAGAENEDLSTYSAVALLCGPDNSKPKVLPAALRMQIDAFADSGKPIFYEWCNSLGYTHTTGSDYHDGRDIAKDPVSRYVYLGEDTETLKQGDLLDSQANTGCIYHYIPKDAVPILYNGGHILKHDHMDASNIDAGAIDTRDWRLWY